MEFEINPVQHAKTPAKQNRLGRGTLVSVGPAARPEGKLKASRIAGFLHIEVHMRRSCLAALLLLPLITAEAQDRTVLLAVHRGGPLEVLAPDTLQTLGAIEVPPLADRVANGSGGIIFLRAGLAPDFKGCCALYALNLKTRSLTKLLSPVAAVVLSPDGKHVITQRGDVGVEVFNARTFEQEPPIPRSIAPGMYGLCFSPDGHLLFGASNFPTPTLDVLDFSERKLVGRFSLPQDVTIRGACVGSDYYLYGQRNASAELWRVRADTNEMAAPVSVKIPDEAAECELHDQRIFGAKGQLFLLELFGGKGDRRARSCGKGVPGGVLLIDPQTGSIKAHLAPDFHFAQLIASADGAELFGIDVRDTIWRSVGLVRLDAVTGRVLAKRDLVPDVWSIGLAVIPAELVPSGEVPATAK